MIIVLQEVRFAAEELGVEIVSLERLMNESDFFSVHIPLNSETYGLIDKEFIAKLKDGAFIIDTSRGGIVDENALAEALIHSKLNGASLDVFAMEPIEVSNPLLSIDNVLLTPHTSSASFGDELEK